MQVIRFRDPQLFLERAESFLLRAEAENNLMLDIAGTARSLGEEAYLATVEHEAPSSRARSARRRAKP